MYKILILTLICLTTSCTMGVHSQNLSQRINVDTSVSIPKNLALDFANSYATRSIAADFTATFTDKYIIINRESCFSKGYGDIRNARNVYSDLVLYPEKYSIHSTLFFTQASLIHKDTLNASDLYRARNMLHTKHILYCWGEYTEKVNQKDFHKFLSALVSLGVQVAPQKPNVKP